MIIMNFKKWLKIAKLNESLKDNYLNYILDKLSNGEPLTSKEKTFLDNISNIDDEDIKDYTHLTAKESYSKLYNLLNKDKTITYDFSNNSGINIKNIEMSMDNGEIIITLIDNTIHNLKDNYLYDILYNIKNDTYSLRPQQEFYEKVPLKND